MNTLNTERFKRIAIYLTKKFRYSFDPIIEIVDKDLKIDLYVRRGNKYYRKENQNMLQSIIEILALLKDQFDINPKITILGHELKIDYTRELAMVAKVKYDALSNDPVPIFFKALEEIPLTEETLRKQIEEALKTQLISLCDEPTLKLKLVDSGYATLVKFDGRQRKKIQDNLPKITMLSALKPEHVISPWYLQQSKNYSSFENYYSRHIQAKLKKYSNHYYLCAVGFSPLLDLATELNIDTTEFRQILGKHKELKRLGC